MAGLKSKTVLVTGGAGFIGSHLVNELADRGAQVIVLDISVDPNSLFVIEKVYRKTLLELIDIKDKIEVLNAFKKYSPEYVFHLAAEPIVEKAYENPYEVFKTNIMGTVNVLEAARAIKSVKGILVTSSDKAYGKTKKAYMEDTPLQGDHPYDVSKSCADLITQTYYKTYGLPVVITRFGNVYGEGDTHLNRIIPGVCEAVIKNNTLEIRSNGKYVRDYVYVKDIVDGCLMLIDNLNKIQGEAFNFSSSENLSVLDVLKKGEKIIGQKILYRILNTSKNEIPYQHLNDEKIRKLGWKNNFTFTQTLPKILDWYKKVYD